MTIIILYRVIGENMIDDVWNTKISVREVLVSSTKNAYIKSKN